MAANVAAQRNAAGAQAPGERFQSAHAQAEMVDRAAAAVARRLGVEMQLPRPMRTKTLRAPAKMPSQATLAPNHRR